ncbi:hypothetical protein C8R47DRAFT_1268557 [Mycena vitilis]|nr:hypothetical protein C8R47DRAFT_1268557 [Mycena vitilis]
MSKARTTEVLEDNELPEFHEKEWIGKQLKYLSSPPPELDAYRTRQLSGGRQFRTVPQALQHLRVPQFALITSMTLLCLLGSTPDSPINAGIKLTVPDATLCKTLQGCLPRIVDAVKALGARKKTGGTGKPGKGKGKQKAVVQDSEDEYSDFPETLGTLNT